MSRFQTKSARPLVIIPFACQIVTPGLYTADGSWAVPPDATTRLNSLKISFRVSFYAYVAPVRWSVIHGGQDVHLQFLVQRAGSSKKRVAAPRLCVRSHIGLYSCVFAMLFFFDYLIIFFFVGGGGWWKMALYLPNLCLLLGIACVTVVDAGTGSGFAELAGHLLALQTREGQSKETGRSQKN